MDTVIFYGILAVAAYMFVFHWKTTKKILDVPRKVGEAAERAYEKGVEFFTDVGDLLTDLGLFPSIADVEESEAIQRYGVPNAFLNMENYVSKFYEKFYEAMPTDPFTMKARDLKQFVAIHQFVNSYPDFQSHYTQALFESSMILDYPFLRVSYWDEKNRVEKLYKRGTGVPGI